MLKTPDVSTTKSGEDEDLVSNINKHHVSLSSVLNFYLIIIITHKDLTLFYILQSFLNGFLSFSKPQHSFLI